MTNMARPSPAGSPRAGCRDDRLPGMTRVPPVLVTGATGQVGRVVVDLLIEAGVPVRALTHRAEAAQVSIIGDVLGRRIIFEELSPDEFRTETQGSWPRPVVDMLLAAWAATIGRPAFITSTVSDILGSAPRSFRQSVADHAAAFIEDPAPSS